jgi:hypothetical protein
VRCNALAAVDTLSGIDDRDARSGAAGPKRSLVTKNLRQSQLTKTRGLKCGTSA